MTVEPDPFDAVSSKDLRCAKDPWLRRLEFVERDHAALDHHEDNHVVLDNCGEDFAVTLTPVKLARRHCGLPSSELSASSNLWADQVLQVEERHVLLADAVEGF